MDTSLQRLAGLIEQLGEEDRAILLAFAEFLAARNPPVTLPSAPVRREIPPPLEISRPAQESIVAGLKRLARTYPMLDKGEMLGATSDIVATHLLQGTEPARVIDELENIFRTHYQQLQAASGES